jgi:hypothetical protein
MELNDERKDIVIVGAFVALPEEVACCLLLGLWTAWWWWKLTERI